MSTEPSVGPTLRSYLLILRRRKWWVIVLALLGLALSLAWSLTATPQYTATAQMLIQPASDPSAVGGAPAPITQTDVLTELQLVTSAPVAAAVHRMVGGVPGVTVAEVGQTNVIGISATATHPIRAAVIANAYARAFVQYRRSIAIGNLTATEEQLRSEISTVTRQLARLHGRAKLSPNAAVLLNQETVLKEQLAQIQVNGVDSSGGVELVTPAQAPTAPSSPKPRQDALLGLACGLVLGVGAAFLRDTVDEALTSKEAVEHWGEAPVLAMVPTVTAWKRRSQTFLVSRASPTSPAAEAYRSLRTSIQFARQERQLGVLLVSSPAAAEGKTSTVSNLGVVFAQAGERVVLVSCDLRRPRIGRFFGVDERAGLADVLLGRLPLRDVLRPAAGQDNLWVLPAGPLPPNPAELLGSVQLRATFAALRHEFDLVLIDSPPIVPVTDAVVLSKEADATLLVVAAGQTRRGDLRRAAEKLAQASAPVVGTVLNQVSKQDGYGYGYGYGYKPYLSEPPLGAVAAHGNGSWPAEAPDPATGEHELR
ncbi:MAG TPA: polysaccharide biosynthesis tyrosine autokinase [Streptosporangiaceae bacterium]